MARFASRFGSYRHGIQNEKWRSLHDGSEHKTHNEIIAVFDQLTLTEDEVQFAIKGMHHKGLPIDRDTEEHFSPRSRISGFDSEKAQAENGWSDEERELVEQKLRESHHYGSDHIELVPQPAALPWPTYDNDGAEQVVLIARATGLVEEAIAYERENRNRDEVLVALKEEPVEEKAVVLDAS